MLQNHRMFDENKFRSICSDFYQTNSEFLSVLLGKVNESLGNNGIIESANPEEERALIEIGYEKKENGLYLDSTFIGRVLQCQKEERRNYHIQNQKHLKTTFLNVLQKEFQSKGTIEIVIGEEAKNNHSHKILSKEDKIKRFSSFCELCLKTEDSKILLGELLQYFQKQLKSSFVCEMVINDAEFVNSGEEFIKESLFVFCSVLSLIPHVSSEDNESVEKETTIQFKDRCWSLGSIIDDGVLNEWIKILRKHHITGDYSKVEVLSTKCVHQRVRKSWCFFYTVY